LELNLGYTRHPHINISNVSFSILHNHTKNNQVSHSPIFLKSPPLQHSPHTPTPPALTTFLHWVAIPMLANSMAERRQGGGIGMTAGEKRNRRGVDETRIGKHLHCSLNEFIDSDFFNW
jgi:hypothetical protein